MVSDEIIVVVWCCSRGPQLTNILYEISNLLNFARLQDFKARFQNRLEITKHFWKIEGKTKHVRFLFILQHIR